MNSAEIILTIVLGVGGILVGSIGLKGVSRLFKGISYRSLAEAAANSVTAMQGQLDIQAKEIETLKTRLADKDRQIDILREQVTNRARVDSLIMTVTNQHEETMRTMARIVAALERTINGTTQS